jgi:hypothetical protein
MTIDKALLWIVEQATDPKIQLGPNKKNCRQYEETDQIKLGLKPCHGYLTAYTNLDHYNSRHHA